MCYRNMSILDKFDDCQVPIYERKNIGFNDYQVHWLHPRL